MRFAIDVSAWDYLDYSKVAPNVDLVVIKLDKRAAEHVTGFHTRGVPIAYYHWLDLTVPINAQVDNSINLIKELRVRPQFLAIDLEQWWTDWQRYYEYLRGRLPVFKVPRAHSSAIYNAFNNAYTLFEKYLNVPIIVYTRTSFVREYMGGNSTCLYGKRFWLAYYTVNNRRLVSWEDARFLVNPDLSHLKLPQYGEVVGWQFTDKIMLPGVYNNKTYKVLKSGVDLNWFVDRIGNSTADTVNAVKRYRVIATRGLNVREQPDLNAKKIGLFKYGDIVLADPNQNVNNFVRVVSPILGWCYSDYLREV